MLEQLEAAIRNFNAEGGKKGYQNARMRNEKAFTVRNLDPRY